MGLPLKQRKTDLEMLKRITQIIHHGGSRGDTMSMSYVDPETGRRSRLSWGSMGGDDKQLSNPLATKRAVELMEIVTGHRFVVVRETANGLKVYRREDVLNSYP